ncbi:MAG: hypothetical protein JW807_02050 [Spirochaetes bacterium]|nr:hypothetical protein [Spirochaetota bacterium]
MLMISLAVLGTFCKKKPEQNVVDFEQINPDNSNDYRYIFRETIREQEERINKYRKKEF